VHHGLPASIGPAAPVRHPELRLAEGGRRIRTSESAAEERSTGRPARFRERWLSGRALLLHLALVIVAPGCIVAAWWQATRALGGNLLSWVYSIEWPLIAVVAALTWWHLVHEDPAAREPVQPLSHAAQPIPPLTPTAGFSSHTTRRAARLAIAVGCELLLGIAVVVVVPLSRPSGWLPAQGDVVYLVHAAFGAFITLGSFALVLHVRGAGRLPGIVAWMGLSGIALACGGGLLTDFHSLIRLLGIAFMFVGTVCAGLSYLIPTFVKLHERAMATPVPASEIAG
jgi:hypothetical protein